MAKPRSVKAFGVAGSLKAQCKIYYTSDFRSRNVGRFSDLVAAKLREQGADELRIRALLLFSLFQSYAVQGKGFSPDAEVLPISLEVGFDPDQLAIGVSFHWKEGRPPILPGISQRVPTGVYQTPFEEVLGFLRQHSAKVLVKYELFERRLELVSLIDRHDGDRRDPMEVIEIDSSTAPYVEASEYIEMGDLDYLGLLKEETSLSDEEERSFDALLAEIPDPDEDTAFDGVDADPVADFDPPSEPDSVSVSDGDSGDDFNEPVLLKGSGASSAEEEPVRFKADAEADAFEQHLIQVKGAARKDSEESGPKWVPDFLKKVFAFGEEAEVVKDSSSRDSEPGAKTVVRGTKSDAVPNEVRTVRGAAGSDPDPDTQRIIDDLELLTAEHGSGEALLQVVKEIKEEVDESKSKRWTDSLMTEVMQEKARLAELTKELNQRARQKENDFKLKERAFATELKRLEEQMKKKDAQLERNREQLTQLSATLERAKSGPTVDVEQQLKHKLATTQKIILQKDEEIRGYSQRMKSLEDRLIVAQARSSRPQVDPQAAAKLQAAERKVEEFKRVNQRLTEALNSPKNSPNKEEVTNLKRKMDSMERQSVELKKSLEKTQFRLKEAQDAERKAQIDLTKALEENRKLRGNRTGEGSSGGQAA